LPRLGQQQRPVEPAEQGLADPFLERPDLVADRRRGDEQFLRGLGEAHVARRGLEGAQGVQRRQASGHGISLAFLTGYPRITRLWPAAIALITGNVTASGGGHASDFLSLIRPGGVRIMSPELSRPSYQPIVERVRIERARELRRLLGRG